MKLCRASTSIGWDGQSLFAFAAAPTEADWLRSRQNPELEGWITYMTEFLETDNTESIAIEKLEIVFEFGQLQ